MNEFLEKLAEKLLEKKQTFMLSSMLINVI